MLASLAILCFVKFMNAQIGVTTCTADGIECVSLSNSICDQFNTLKCVCPADHRYQEKPDKSGCDYNCGFLTNPTHGAVATTGPLQSSFAVYTCSEGFKLTFGNARNCIVGIGWSDVLPKCVKDVDPDFAVTVPLGVLIGMVILSIAGCVSIEERCRRWV